VAVKMLVYEVNIGLNGGFGYDSYAMTFTPKSNNN
jgi:hypothetical protein